jgi:hypothetical protein
MERVVVVWLVLSGCSRSDSDSGDWGAHAITKIQYGPFTVTIPPGWRDASELKDATTRAMIPAGERWLAPQKPKERTAMESIRLNEQKGLGAVSCVDVEAQLRREGKRDVEVVPLDASGHPGCKVKFFAQDHHRAVIATVGRDLYRFDCIGDTPALEVACASVFAQLDLDYTPAPRAGVQAAVDKFSGVMVKARERALACYRRGISRHHKDPSVKVVLAIDIAADGSAIAAVRSTDDEKVGEWVAAVIRETKFPLNLEGTFDETIEW